MGPADCARVRGSGQEKRPTARPVSGPAGHDAHPVSGADGGVMASEKSVRVWEAAYRRYGHVWELTARAHRSATRRAAREMAAASWAVAAAWRQIAAATTLPWWTLVAVEAAAAAFKAQAHEYQACHESENS